VPARARIASLAFGLALLAGCGGGGYGDPPSPPLADEYGPGERLCKILGPADWADPTDLMSQHCSKSPPPDHAVYSTGLTIIAIDRYDETGKGAVGNYYAQDTTCGANPYAGVTIFGPSFSPPDLRLAVGDVVDVNGSITEFVGPSSGRFGECATLPEISGTLSFRFDSTTLPDPVVIPITDLASYPKARQWLGMLVKVENVKVDSATASGGRYQPPITNSGASSVTDQPKITNELYDIQGEGPAIADGTTFKSVTGIVTYFYGFHLVPRSPADFEQ
jgi:hypothetical protein